MSLYSKDFYHQWIWEQRWDGVWDITQLRKDNHTDNRGTHVSFIFKSIIFTVHFVHQT